MTFNSPTQIQGIWQFATRQITGFLTAITVTQSADNAALANGTTVAFVVGINNMCVNTVVGIAATNVTWNFGLTNGTTFRQGTTGASGAAAMFHGVGIAGEALALNNSGTVSGNYTYAAAVWNR